MELTNELLAELREPFAPEEIQWKPGVMSKEKPSAMGLAYADPRAYMNRLDAVCGPHWQVRYVPWGDRIICELTIMGVTRSSTGEPDNDAERNEIGGTVAEAQALKRACAMFGLGRYLYELPSTWAEYDKQKRQFTDAGKAKLMGVLKSYMMRLQPKTTQRIRATDADIERLEKLALEYYGEGWQGQLDRVATTVDPSAHGYDDISVTAVQPIAEGLERRIAKRKEEQAQVPLA